jgi:hypothetical protein
VASFFGHSAAKHGLFSPSDDLIGTAFQALTELDNSLVSEPEIRCNSDTIEMRFRTKHRFTGAFG